MICAYCKKKMKKAGELIYVLPNGEEVGLHTKCEKPYNEGDK